MPQFIGLANYFRDHVPNMIEMVKPLRDMIPLGKYQRTGKLIWTTESSAAFKLCQQAISNCQELYFLEDTTTPILQTDASDYGIGGYLYMVTNGKVRVIRFFRPSWPLLSRNILYPMQFFNKLQKCREFLNDPTIADRTITQFIRQCPCCQVMSRLKLLIKTHPFTSYNPFESLHIDHIGPLPVDDKGNSHILVMIDAFSRWVE
jgi:hypothetical protein